jgi:hypothetical protein
VLSSPIRKYRHYHYTFYETATYLTRRTTEILDVAPIDIFNAISTKFVHNFEAVLPDHLRAQALDFEFHWVNETGKQALLTAGAVLNPTVRASCILKLGEFRS